MKKKNYLFSIYFVLFSVIGLLIVFGGEVVQAVEEGGQVQTNAGLVFSGEESSDSKPPHDSSTSDSSTSSSSSSNNTPKEEKPIGRLPSTGELVKKSLSITGGALLLIVFGLFLLKKVQHKKRGG
ncbi:LPXTG cell wall anchor domain-containing protein [Enterococcus sp. DIV0242_7C1]|uniref:Gram-positive cocci surface proteins LPxTG domain-containing protein n=1 Tax=Candidatus Enterococcus dunnyi TaxID=1834192 RepID=A0A200JBK5_9ENTE|nr:MULTISPECIES: LPXTG cell wall anchor domain-containing protein [unclassified Enterococcus]MBO0471755.1 LPXTG cell wall anchor domain-containing protein [Enterococcus sp. DIV0242_7C1]OUZ34612.1 hypothetical protein A5889_000087 [Enterococcus sp. 9D6_DIV0238]